MRRAEYIDDILVVTTGGIGKEAAGLAGSSLDSPLRGKYLEDEKLKTPVAHVRVIVAVRLEFHASGVHFFDLIPGQKIWIPGIDRRGDEEEGPHKAKPVVLTFDDGYADAYEVVFPLLLEYGYTGTFFVLATPTHFEAPGYLTWAQMQEMAQAGMEIQAHGRDHVDLRGRSNDYLVYQILGIQEAIHSHTDQLPRFFCYPSGRYDDNVIAVLKSAGYWGAVTTEWGNTHTLEVFFEMSRVRIRGSDTLGSFISKLES